MKSMNKKGVSLVAVLLFMMIATIAGTATFKWLGSENKSSSNRMLVAEAMQASRAGLENARAWMTYNGNDVGAMIKQFIDGENKPLKMDDFLTGIGGSKQQYSVWLVGVNTDNATYKLKLTSTGYSRNKKAKYSENSILSVDGLHQVKIPRKSAESPFDEAFHGSLATAGALNVNSATINGSPAPTNAGGVGFNDVNVVDHLVITGNAEFNANTKVGSLYIVGDFLTCTNVTVDKDSYIGGDLYGPMGAGVVYNGDLLVGGKIDLTSGGPRKIGGCSGSLGGMVRVLGNLTSRGNVYMPNNNAGAWDIDVYKNFVAEKALVFNANGTGNQTFPFDVAQNTYIVEGVSGSHYYGDINNVHFGTENTSEYSTYAPGFTKVKDLYPGENNETYYCSNCEGDCDENGCNGAGSGAFFNVNGSYYSSGIPDKLDSWRASEVEDLKAKVTMTGGKDIGCPTDAYVEDPLQFNKDVLKYENILKGPNAICPGMSIWGQWPSNFVQQLNTCYSTAASAKKLYDEKWLVVELNSPMVGLDNDAELNGHFIFIIKNENPHDYWLYLPPTSTGSEVFIYFPDGWNKLGFKNSNKENSYFIFSDKNIGVFQMDYDNPMNGSVFMAKCAALNSANPQNPSVSARSNKMLNDALVNSAVLCNNDHTDVCSKPAGGSGGSSGVSSGGSTGSDAGNDEFYIASAPQLYVSVETQYKNDELDPETLKSNDITTLAPSIIVLPRVVYMTRNASGRLADYYNVVNLNGAKEQKNSDNVTCTPAGLPVSGDLFDGTTPLPETIFKCNYASTQYGDENPFWVYVSGQTGSTPPVRFVDEAEYVYPNGPEVVVSLSVPVTDNPGAMSVDLRLSADPSWTITPNAAYVQEHTVSSGVSGETYYTVNISTSGQLPLFTVSVGSGASTRPAIFELLPPNNGCTIGTPSRESVSMEGTANVIRAEIPETYCAEHSKIQSTNGVEFDCADIVSRPSCTSDLMSNRWVSPNCRRSVTLEANEKWTCATSAPISLIGATNVGNYCEAFVVPDMTVAAPENEATYPLYASLKRKPFTLNIKNVGNDLGSVETIVETSVNGSDYTRQTDCDGNANQKQCTIYAGDFVRISYGDSDNEFNYWKCISGDCMDNPARRTEFMEFRATQNTSVELRFNSRDEHCFFDAFHKEARGRIEENFSVFCPTNNYRNCIDKCATGDRCSVKSSTTTYGGADPKANWLMVRYNKAGGSCIKSHYEMWKGTVCDEWSQNEFVPLVMDGATGTSGGSISNYNSASNSSIILNTVDAGNNGQMKVNAYIAAVKKESVEKNGFIFRSNADATEYLRFEFALDQKSVIFGLIKTDVTPRGRVCKVSNNGTTDVCSNWEAFKDKEFSWFQDRSGKVLLDITVQENTLTVSADANGSDENFGTHLFDLTSYGYKDDEHRFVGLQLRNSNFDVYDVSWTSFDDPSDCWDSPQIYCSFRSKYLGGIVPINENVTPWINVGSWFTEQGCQAVSYYYNGCDLFGGNMTGNECGKSQPNGSRNGIYYEKGSKQSSSTYNFTSEGPHGYYTTGKDNGFLGLGKQTVVGYEKSASIEVVCPHMVYTAECGYFNVGTIESCIANEYMYNGSLSVALNGTDSVDLGEGMSVNLRDADLVLNISGLNNGSASFHLVDADGGVSSEIDPEITQNGIVRVVVNSLANVDNFNPQNVRKVVFKSKNSSFTVNSVESACPNAFGIAGCFAEFNGSVFTIHSTITNPMAAKDGCTLTSNAPTDEIPAMSQDCPYDGVFEVTDRKVYENFTGDEKSYIFTISAQDKQDNVVSCTTEPVVVKKTTVACDISPDNVEIYEGQESPAFRYSFANCPRGKCTASVGLEGATPTSVTFDRNCSDVASCQKDTWTAPTVHLAAGEASKTFKYVISYGEERCDASFRVKKPAAATATSCRIEDKVFKADITAPEYQTATLHLNYFDYIGNPISAEQPVAATDDAFTYTKDLSSITTAGSYTIALLVNGKDVGCSAVLEVTATPETPSSATATCGFSKTYAGQSATFDVSNISGVTQNIKPTLTIGSGSKEIECNENSCWSNTITLPAAGSYAYSLTYGGATMCSGTVTVNDVISCSSEPVSVGVGDSYSFKSSKPGDVNCWGCTFTYGTQTESNANIGTITKVATAIGTLDLSMACTCENVPASCSTTLSVVETAPRFSCSQAIAKVGQSNNVTITPTSVEGCDNGCVYTIAGTSVTGSGYTSGNLPSFTGSGSAEDVEIFEVSLTNDAGETKKECSVKYTDVSGLVADFTKSSDQIERDGFGDRPTFDLNDGQCVGVDKITSKITIGCWGQGSKNIQYQDCSGNIYDKTIECNGWNDLYISETCTVYVKAVGNGFNMKFGAW